MSYTKGELVQAALEEIGIASYEFDISPEQIDSGLVKLDSMMAEWLNSGITLSFPIATKNASSADEDSNLPDLAWEAVITNLAIRLAPSYGKNLSQDTRNVARRAFVSILRRFSKPRQAQFNVMPKGAGYKATWSRFTQPPKQEYLENVDEEVDISGGPV